MSLWKKLFKTDAKPAAAAVAPAAPRAPALPETLEWVEAQDSTFGLRCLDCRAVALRRKTVAPDKSIEGRWARERANDGRRLSGQRPEHAVTLEALLLGPMNQPLPADGPVFKGDHLDEKWDVYLFDGWLYFVRSWSGLLVYRASVRVEMGKMIVERIDAPSDAADSDADFCIREVDYLIKTLLYRVPAPHPLPRDFKADDDGIAEFSFQRHGDRGWYATWGDTLGLAPPESGSGAQ
jgi:hypothetical protein